MKQVIFLLAALCAISWYGLYNKYLDNEALHQRLEMAEANNSVLERQIKELRDSI